MSFVYYDLAFLVLFSVFLGIFLYKKRKKLEIQSKVFLLYRTKIGIKVIDWLGKKLGPCAGILSNLAIITGFTLFIGIFILLIQTVILMIQIPTNIPPILPLLPYVPQLFKLPLPPFYFTYWIIIILIVAIVHEFAHGIFAKFHKLDVKATGFGALGPFLAAFVELDEKKMARKKPKKQMSILAAGTFSNLIFAVIFLLILQLFFSLAYTPIGIGGYIFAGTAIDFEEITGIGDYSLENFLDLSNQKLANIDGKVEVKTNLDSYYLTPYLIQQIALNKKLVLEKNSLPVYLGSPALKANLSGAIQKIGNTEIKNPEQVLLELSNYNPGQILKITTSDGEYEIVLDKHPQNSSRGFLGIGFIQIDNFRLFVSSLSSPYFSPFTIVEAKGNQEVTLFFKDLLWWLVLVSFLIALFNMLPLPITDGGKFLYIFTQKITKSKKIAMKVFKVFSSLVYLIFLLLILIWLTNIF
ncbi:MAG: site-2 protease family protein [archaeon]